MSKDNRDLLVGLDIGTSKVVALVVGSRWSIQCGWSWSDCI
jgi:cell division ATPase FtsA